MKRSDLTKIVHQLVFADTDDGICRITEYPAPTNRRRITIFTTKEVRTEVMDDCRRAVEDHTPEGVTVDFTFQYVVKNQPA